MTALDLFSVGALDMDDLGPSAEYYRELHDNWTAHAIGGETMTEHTHTHEGQTLTHSHPGGDAGHGYYDHPEDAPAFAANWTGPTWRIPQPVAPVETGEPWRSSAEREWDDSR